MLSHLRMPLVSFFAAGKECLCEYGFDSSLLRQEISHFSFSVEDLFCF